MIKFKIKKTYWVQSLFICFLLLITVFPVSIYAFSFDKNIDFKTPINRTIEHVKGIEVASLTASIGDSLTSISERLAEGWILFTEALLNNTKEVIHIYTPSPKPVANAIKKVEEPKELEDKNLLEDLNTTNTVTPIQQQIIQAGLVGQIGPRGEQGPKGDTGERGPKGEKGESGNSIDTSSFVTRSFLDGQVNRIYDATSDNLKDSIDSLSYESPLTFNSLFTRTNNAISLNGLSGFGTAGQIIRTNATADGLEWATPLTSLSGAALLESSNTFTQINPLITPAESWIGPSSTTGIYFKGGNVGIGTTNPTAYLQIEKTFTGTTPQIGLNTVLSVQPGATPPAYTSFSSQSNLARWSGTYNGGNPNFFRVQGLANRADTLNSSFDLTYLIGSRNDAYHQNVGNVYEAVGLEANVLNLNTNGQTGDISNAYGGKILLGNNKTTGVITNGYGLWIGPSSGYTGTITNQYGVYIAPTIAGGSASSKWGIYDNSGNKSYFGNSVGIGTTNLLESALSVNRVIPAGTLGEYPAGQKTIVNATSATTQADTYYGNFTTLSLGGAGNYTNSSYGVGGYMYNSGTGTVNSMAGLNFVSGNISTGSTTTLYGIKTAFYSPGSGSVWGAYGLDIGNITSSQIVGGVTGSAIGLRIGDVTAGAVSNYSIYSGSAKSYFAGSIGIGTTAPVYKLDVKGLTSTSGIRSDIGYDIYQVPDPTAPTGVVSAGGSVDTGTHWYAVTYTTAIGETHSVYTSSVITTTAGNNTVTLTIPVSTDPRVTGRKIYRTKAGENDYQDYLLTTISNNTQTTYVDTAADSTLSGLNQAGYFRINSTSNQITLNGQKNMTIDLNATYLGYLAGASVTTAGRNTLMGTYSGFRITTGSSNQFFGHSTGYNTTSGGSNVGMGYGTLANNTIGSVNTALGHDSLYNNVTGDNNTAIGSYSLFGVNGDSMSANTAIGYFAGNASVGDRNIFLGYYAGAYETGSNTLIIDSRDRTNEANQRSQALIYGVTNATPASQILALGGGGNVGINMTNPSVALDITGDIEYTGIITDVSDERLKENFSPITGALDMVLGIQGKYYNMINTPDRLETGFIAQNVKEYVPSAVSIVDIENGYMGISYPALIPISFEAIRELDLKLKDLSSLDTSSATSLASLMKNFLGEVENSITDLYATIIHADKIETKMLCVGNTCVSEEQFLEIVNKNVSQPEAPKEEQEPTPEPPTCTEPQVLKEGVCVDSDQTIDSSAVIDPSTVISSPEPSADNGDDTSLQILEE